MNDPIDPAVYEARILLDRLVRAEWAVSDAFEGQGCFGHSDALTIAEADWADALTDAVTFLGIERPQSVFADQEIPMSKENRTIVERNMAEWIGAHKARLGLINCPSCGRVTKEDRIAS